MFSAAPISGLHYYSGRHRQQRGLRIRSCRGHKVRDLCQVHGGVIEEGEVDLGRQSLGRCRRQRRRRVDGGEGVSAPGVARGLQLRLVGKREGQCAAAAAGGARAGQGGFEGTGQAGDAADSVAAAQSLHFEWMIRPTGGA